MACCSAVLFFAACDKECDISGDNTGGDGNSIILHLSSGSLPVSRGVEATGAEVRVDHIDVLIFDEGGGKKWHERIGGSETGSGTIALKAKRSSFDMDARYWVYLIANSTVAEEEFAAEDFDREKLRAMKQEDRYIHVTGLKLEGLTIPQTFLMDGAAYPEGESEPSDAGTVVLNNGNKSDDTKLKVTLRRAAAKLVIRINKGESVTFNNSSGASYYLRNMPYSTSVMAGVDGEAKLRTTIETNTSYFKWTENQITVTAYAYAHSWENLSALEKEIRLIVNIPITYTPLDADGNPDGDAVLCESNYYQIPVCEGSELKRNTCYQVSLTLNVPGGTAPSAPAKLENIAYDVQEWSERTINIGGEGDRPAYLTLNRTQMEMHNIATDNTTLRFVSSSDVTAKVTRAYYIDKFGKEQEVSQTIRNKIEITLTPEAGLNGGIEIYSPVPENNTIRYIDIEVKNDDGMMRTVKVDQYPLVYITNIEGWYSYRDDFVSEASDGNRGVTTWELLAGKKITKGQWYSSRQVPSNNWRCSYSWKSNEYYNGTNDYNGIFFGSKVAQGFTDDGLCSVDYYYWRETSREYGRQRQYRYDTYAEEDWASMKNHRMYHVFITATSNNYTLGRPRITEGKTDPNADNAQLVSPSFMIASQLGGVFANSDMNVNDVAEHCEKYVEVSRNGVIYDDWRLPTAAEINIIYKYQDESASMDKVLSGDRYWSASGPILKPILTADPNATPAIRCIRDAYDGKTPANQ